MGPYFCSLTTQDLQRVILWFHWLLLLCIWRFHKTLLFWEVQSSCDLVLGFVLFGKLCLGKGCWSHSGIQVTYVAELLYVYTMVMQNVASNPPAFVLAVLCPGLIPLTECSAVLIPYIYVAVVLLLLNMHVLRVELTWACSGVPEIRGKWSGFLLLYIYVPAPLVHQRSPVPH